MADDLSMFGVSNAPSAATPKSSGDDLSMFNVKPAPAAPKDSSFIDDLESAGKTIGQTAASIGSSVIAPAGAMVDRAAQYLSSKIPGSANYGKPVTSYTADKQDLTYQPTDPSAQGIVKGVGTVLKPVGDVLNGTSKVLLNDLYGDNDPEHISMLSDALAYATPGLKSTVKVGDAAAEEIASQAPSIANHPAVQAANDLAGKYDIDLTKGQQVQQAASGVGDTATARALTVPYQVEAATAGKATPVGKALNNHFADQQNTLAGHVQDVSDGLRAAGEDDAADAVEGTIKPVSPGVSVVSGPKLQRVVNRDLIDDPALSSKLDELNDLSGVIDPPAKGPIVDSPSTVSKITDYLTGGKPVSVAAGSAVGAAVGAKLGTLVGHPFIGADLGAAVGGGAVRKLLSKFQSGDVDLNPVTNADLGTAAKELDITPDQLATELQKPVNQPVIKPSRVPAQGRFVNDQYMGPNGEAPAAAPAPTTPGAAAAQALGPTPAPTVQPTAAPAVQQAPIISTPTLTGSQLTQNIYDSLKQQPMTITFNKIGNGEQRVMNASLRDEHLPEGFTSDTDKFPQPKGTLLTAWDLDKGAWRSFHSHTVTKAEPRS